MNKMSERPSIEPEEMAKTEGEEDSSIAESIDSNAGWEQDSTDESEEELGSDYGGMDELSDSSITIGEMYCRGLTALSNELVKKHGSGDPPFLKDNGELDLTFARDQLFIDEYVNALMAEHGRQSDMAPGTALIIATAMFMIAVVGSDPELVSGLRNAIKKDEENELEES